jgi:uncharacterized protein (TIGR00251 family)
MKIEVRVRPGAKRAAVETQANGALLVRVKEPAIEGRANEAVIEAIAEHFAVPKSSVTILRGHSNRNKLVEIAQR